MIRNNKTALEKLAKLEETKKTLIDKRNKEFLDILHKYQGLTVDDHLLAGFLLFAANSDNKDNSILKEFKELSKSRKNPRSSKH